MKNFTVSELLELLPPSIIHKDIEIDYKEKDGNAPLVWSKDDYEWNFLLIKERNPETKEIEYILGYALWGWEGVESMLPWTEEEEQEAWDIGLLPSEGGIRDTDLLHGLEKLYSWVKENNLA